MLLQGFKNLFWLLVGCALLIGVCLCVHFIFQRIPILHWLMLLAGFPWLVEFIMISLKTPLDRDRPLVEEQPPLLTIPRYQSMRWWTPCFTALIVGLLGGATLIVPLNPWVRFAAIVAPMLVFMIVAHGRWPSSRVYFVTCCVHATAWYGLAASQDAGISPWSDGGVFVHGILAMLVGLFEFVVLGFFAGVIDCFIPAEIPQDGKTCPTCHYDLTDNTSGSCPECNEDVSAILAIDWHGPDLCE